MAAKLPTNAPMKAVATINIAGLSILSNRRDILWARILSLLVLIHHASPPHNRNKAVNPARKATPALRGTIAVTIKAVIAILHHGIYKQAVKLSSIIRSTDMMNFIE
jgi:hypothetical protein